MADKTSPYSSPLEVDKPTLVHLAHSTSYTILWLLEELNVDYDLILVPRPAGEANYPRLFETHPLGKSPQLHLPGRRVITQQPAICLYLLTTYDTAHRFHPPKTTSSTAASTTTAPATTEAAGTEIPAFIRDEELIDLAISDLNRLTATKLVFILLAKRVPWPFRIIFDKAKDMLFSLATDPDLRNHFTLLNGDLAGRDYFLGGPEPTRSDLVLRFSVDLCAQSGLVDLEEHPNLKAWLQRCNARPAWKRALEKGNGYDLDVVRRHS